jgi:hypothetical protein
MEKVYDIWIELNKELMMVRAENLTEALQETKKELNKIIDSITEEDLKKNIDTERGLHYYEFKKKDNSSLHATYDNTDIVIYDALDYSYVEGKKFDDFGNYDLLNWDRPEIKHLVTHSFCSCCDHVLPKKDIKDCWGEKDNILKNECKEKGLNYEYLEDISSICNTCIADKKYMGEYNRIKEIEEEFKAKGAT